MPRAQPKKGKIMNMFITGGLGFVGRHLSSAFLLRGHRVTTVGRSQNPSMIDHPDFRYVAADTTQTGDWQELLRDQQVVVNLAGKNIFTIWTEKTKRQIYDSRISTTRHLVEALPAGGDTTLCSTSAIGYYGDRGDDMLSDDEPPGDDFLAEVGRDWENEALKAESKGVRVVLARFGIVLHRDGGAMAKMIRAFRMFVGGSLGSGRQWFSWIHMRDLLNAYQFVIDRPDVHGPLNYCAPEPVRNEQLVKTLAAKLKRPAVLKAPAFMVKIVLGEFGKVLLASQRVRPTKLKRAGFEFEYADIDSALEQIVS
jgi:uncharacterized protein (TIGR01777 family)